MNTIDKSFSCFFFIVIKAEIFEMVKPPIYINKQIVSSYKETFNVDLEDMNYTCNIIVRSENKSAISVCSESSIHVKSIQKEDVTTFGKIYKIIMGNESLKHTRSEDKKIILTSPLVVARIYELARALSEGYFGCFKIIILAGRKMNYLHWLVNLRTIY